MIAAACASKAPCAVLSGGHVVTRAACTVQGMSLVPAVTELMLAELLYLQYDNPIKPIFMYINSAGVQARRAATLPLPRERT